MQASDSAHIVRQDFLPSSKVSFFQLMYLSAREEASYRTPGKLNSDWLQHECRS
jgi:hypothetical protein